MRSSLLTSCGFLALVSAAIVQPTPVRKSYDGYKVFRLTVGDEVGKVSSIIERLGLSTWKGKPKAGGHSDIVVPPSQIQAFETAIKGMKVSTMHEDLGASIAQESTFHTYAGMLLTAVLATEPVVGHFSNRDYSRICQLDMVRVVP